MNIANMEIDLKPDFNKMTEEEAKEYFNNYILYEFPKHRKIWCNNWSQTIGQHDAEEATQNIFTSIWEKRKNFNPKRGIFNQFVYYTLRRYYIKVLRNKYKKEKAYDPKKFRHLIDDHNDRIDRFYDIINRLSETDKEISILRFEENRSVRYISEKLNMQPYYVRKRLQNMHLYKEDRVIREYAEV